ncbi:hypothetical protein D3C84_808350 [compost metagenome]
MAQLFDEVAPSRFSPDSWSVALLMSASPGTWPLSLMPWSFSLSPRGSFSSGAEGVSHGSLSVVTVWASTSEAISSGRLADWLKLNRQKISAESSGCQYSGLYPVATRSAGSLSR